jgi:hypothetical protein
MNARTTGLAALFSLTLAATIASVSLQAAPRGSVIGTGANSQSTELAAYAQRDSQVPAIIQPAVGDNALAIAKSEDRPGLYRRTDTL